MPHTLFQKTARGRAEIVHRSPHVPAAMRSVLIMVNGSDAVATLAARGLPQVREHIQALIALGLIEPVATPPPPAPPPPPPETPTPPPVLDALCRQAQARLSAHFGPDTAHVVQPLRAARTVAAFNAALNDIEARLATHMGRKHAARELQGLRPPP